jgi:HSP20 family protein
MTQIQTQPQTQNRPGAQSAGSDGGQLSKTSPDRGGIARASDFRRQIDRTLVRLMRQFDRDPIRALFSLPQQLDRIANWPAIDIAEDEKAITVRVDVPGMNPDELNIEVSGNQLTIRGQKQDEWSDNERGVRRRERVSGSFARTITLPADADAQNVQARYDRGTLAITIPKIPGKGPRHVQVQGTPA